MKCPRVPHSASGAAGPLERRERGTGVCGAGAPGLPAVPPPGEQRLSRFPGASAALVSLPLPGSAPQHTDSDNAPKTKIFPLNCLFLPDLKGSSGSLCVAKLQSLYIRKCSHLLTQPSLFVLSFAPDVPPAMDKESNSTSLEVGDASLLLLDIFISPVFPEAEGYCASFNSI